MLQIEVWNVTTSLKLLLGHQFLSHNSRFAGLFLSYLTVIVAVHISQRWSMQVCKCKWQHLAQLAQMCTPPVSIFYMGAQAQVEVTNVGPSNGQIWANQSVFSQLDHHGANSRRQIIFQSCGNWSLSFSKIIFQLEKVAISHKHNQV